MIVDIVLEGRAVLTIPELPPDLGTEPNLLVVGAEHGHFPHLMVSLYQAMGWLSTGVLYGYVDLL